MAITLIIALYTSRIVLKTLGITDYGIYNVVGGVVGMLAFISNSLADASSRYITFAIGKGETDKLSHLFSCIFSIHLIIAIILVIIAETIGLYFVMEKLIIPENRKFAAMFVYQASIITFFIGMISVPYDAIVIAYEHMDAFAYISIIEVSVRLLIVYFLYIIPFDRLIVYSILVLLVQQLLRFIYINYCHRHFPESHAHWRWDKKLSKKIFSYAGWIVNGNLAVIGYTQGLNILLNLFFGPTVNAARGIAVQVQNAVNQFFASFQTAVSPQITKSYAAGDYAYMHQLIIYSSKFSFYLAWLIVLPLFYETSYILHIWLGDVPKYTQTFVRIMLMLCLCSTLKMPCLTAIHATGDIKKFQLIEGSMLLTILPIAYIGLKFFHCQPEYVFYVFLIIESITQIIRVLIVFTKINFPFCIYLLEVIKPIFIVCSTSYLISYILCTNDNNIIPTLFNLIIILFTTTIIILSIGLNKKEKKYLFSKVKSYL
jgi:O-antigen/teichoic acid export membrane protein